MDILKILAELHEERTRLDETIAAIERLAADTGVKRRGRPPQWLQEAKGDTPKPRKKRKPAQCRDAEENG